MRSAEAFTLETNTCIRIFDSLVGSVRARYREVRLVGAALFVSSVVLFEIRYGVERSAYPFENRQRLEEFLHEGVEVLPFTDTDAEAAGQIRNTLEKQKQPIGPYDTLIAGQALARGLTLGRRTFVSFPALKG